MRILSYRLVNLYAVLIVILVLIAAAYIQFYDNLPPCPLCVIQRVIFAWLGLLFLAGLIYIPKTAYRKIYNFIILLFCCSGVAVSIRHIRLQHLPINEIPACGPGLNFIVKHLPPIEAVKMLLMGSGECAKINWTFLLLTIPEWALIFFIILMMLAVAQIARQQV